LLCCFLLKIQHLLPVRIFEEEDDEKKAIMNRTTRKLPASFYREIGQLIRKNHIPKTKLARSNIAKDAGDGVFVTMDVPISTPLCLYPGIYTPGLPLHVSRDVDDVVYLANELLPPSGISIEDNAYILNVTEIGGYIDGQALEEEFLLESSEPRTRVLDENPSACAHKINHSSRFVNTDITPFYWTDVLEESDNNNVWQNVFRLPNSIRSDGSPWYFDGFENRLHHFMSSYTDRCVSLCGVAVVSIENIAAGDELLLNYKLRSPLPRWACDWYDSS
jgi:hypothetical protein